MPQTKLESVLNGLPLAGLKTFDMAEVGLSNPVNFTVEKSNDQLQQLRTHEKEFPEATDRQMPLEISSKISTIQFTARSDDVETNNNIAL